MLTATRRIAKWSLRVLAIVVGVLATIVVGYAIQTRIALPELAAWHRLDLKEEFHAGRADVQSFEDYRRLEDRLFAELRSRLLDDPQAVDQFALGRYRPGSVPAQLALDTRYNRSYELAPAEPKGSVLLVHGLSDSPYSFRALAETFFEQGYHVIVLRLPGHGTIPAGLLDVDWHDWYAAVSIAAKHAAMRAGPGKPFLAGGHSTGAALLTLYSVRTLDDPALPRPERLFLLSPAIGISDLAVLTNVISALSFLPMFEKSDWVGVLPEYDPYKYNSFPVNAGNQIYRVTQELQRELEDAGTRGRLGDMPRVTVFHSLVDATVNTPDVVQGLLALLPARGHELVVFDVNRIEALQGLIAQTPMDYLEKLREARDLSFRVTLIGNSAPGSLKVAAYVREAGAGEVAVTPLPLEWPRGVISLGHVAIPFPIDDPVYGLSPGIGEGPKYALGAFSARGEAGAFVVPLDMLARLRCNPFFDVIRSKVIE
ncbi:MAG TPA: alpha/beta fold hydrolase [Woeseiaceae bacterium]|nr:alpha/beta fold hydrolase [Woeseiaceae bacterium]